jgi:predicted dehydrogenase
MKRYAIVGLGHRCAMYIDALLGEYKRDGVFVGFCDTNDARMAYYNRQLREHGALAAKQYAPKDFSRMLREQGVDTVIVTSLDRTHHEYIIKAMRAGCDVITEKPLTIDAQKARAIIDAQQHAGKNITVTFNYRYAPHSSKIKELLMRGAIGKIISVHFEWTLDTRHGADYFRRWHRNKENSGGLMVHKSTHHFDLVNWWLESAPETVYGIGQLAFYGFDNAKSRKQKNTYTRVRNTPAAQGDPFAFDLNRDPRLKALYYDTEHIDGYFRDQGVFSKGIDIEDDMAVLVKYTNGATMTYHLTAYSPWEGLRVMFNGTEGRLEMTWEESSFNSPNGEATREEHDLKRLGIAEWQPVRYNNTPEIVLRRQWCKPVRIPIKFEKRGHGGGDARLLADLFRPGSQADPLRRAAGLRDGVNSILTGIAANRSFVTGKPVSAQKLLGRVMD